MTATPENTKQALRKAAMAVLAHSDAADISERLKAVASRLDSTPGAVAVAWALRNPAVDGAIVGFRRPDQVDPIIGAANLELSDEDVAALVESA